MCLGPERTVLGSKKLGRPDTTSAASFLITYFILEVVPLISLLLPARLASTTPTGPRHRPMANHAKAKPQVVLESHEEGQYAAHQGE